MGFVCSHVAVFGVVSHVASRVVIWCGFACCVFLLQFRMLRFFAVVSHVASRVGVLACCLAGFSKVL